MKNYGKKLVVFLTSLCLFASIMSGCNQTSVTGSKNEPTGPTDEELIVEQDNKAFDTANNHFTLYRPEMTTPIDLDGDITKAVMEMSGIVWESVEVGSGGDIAQQVNMKLASNTLGDVLVLSSSNELWGRIINEKKVIPLDKYFDDPERYPNLAKIDKRVLDYHRFEDGHIYYVPQGYEPVLEEPSGWNENAGGLWIRDDILKKAGMEREDLTTLEGFEEYLKKVKGLKDEEGRPIIPLSLGGEKFSGYEIVEAIFGVEEWNKLSDGKMVPDYQTEGFKKAWQWLNKMYVDGLLDKETPYHKIDLYKEKINSLRYAAMIFNGWDNPNMLTMREDGINELLSYVELKEIGMPEKWISPIPLPKIDGIKIGKYAFTNPFGTRGTAITNTCENPDLVMRAFDLMLTSEVYRLMEWGPEELGNYTMIDGVAKQNSESFSGPDYWGGGMANVTKRGFWWWKGLVSPLPTKNKMYEDPWPAYNAMLVLAENINREQGAVQEIPNYKRIKTVIGGSVEKYTPIQEDIKLKYYAKMCMASTPEEFNDVYEQFLNEMKVRGHDSETVAEVNEQLNLYNQTPAGKITIEVRKITPRNAFGDKAIVTGN